MLLGSSYSLMVKESDDEIIIQIPKFKDYYQEALKVDILNNKLSEYKFKIVNESNSDIKYHIDITPSLNNKVNEIINYSYTINNDVGKTANLAYNNIINQNQVLEKNKTDNYKVDFFFNSIYDSLEPFKTTIEVFVTKNTSQYGVDVIENLNNNEVKKVDDEIRFVSSNSNNYVWFNCNNNSCEKWRIIGSFKQEKENSKETIKSLKIMRDEVLFELAFNMNELDGKFDNSYANSYLNGFYYDTMNDNTKKLILKGRFNIGDVNTLEYKKAYEEEKKEYYYTYIGLLNTSDYLASSNWMNINYKTLLLNKNNNDVNIINDGITTNDAYEEIAYIPVVYLRSDVTFINGKGTSDNPYSLGFE